MQLAVLQLAPQFLPQKAEIWLGRQVGVKVCDCVHANWLNVGVVMGGAYPNKEHNFQMDSQSSTRFSGKAGHEPKDSW